MRAEAVSLPIPMEAVAVVVRCDQSSHQSLTRYHSLTVRSLGDAASHVCHTRGDTRG